MENTPKKATRMSRATQRKFLVLLLVGILGVCVGIAWYMTVRIDAPTHQGIEIIKDMRTRKLLSFWGEQKTHHQHYFLYQRAGGKLALVGWRFSYRGPNSDPQKGFVGGDFEWDKFLTKSSWTLTNGLDKGTYESNFMRMVDKVDNGQVVGKEGVWVMLASIELNGGNIQIQQNIKGQKTSAGSEIPDNYIPEGALPLVYREVAKRRTHAKFKMIFDSLAPVGTKPRFGTLEVEYLTVPKNDPAGGILEVKSIVLSSVSTKQIILDGDGNIVREESDTMLIVPVTQKQFAAKFPIHAYSPFVRGPAAMYPKATKPDATTPKVTIDEQGDPSSDD